MKTMGISSFSNSTFLFTPIPFTISGGSSYCFLSSSLLPLSQPTHFPSLYVSHSNNSSQASAFNKGRKGAAATTLIETGGSEDDDDEEEELIDFIDEFDGGDEEDDDEGVFVPLEQMNKWLESKPRGFGEGKVYDTSIEDKLFEEIQQSKQAQLVNVNNLKNNPGSKKDDKKTNKVVEGVVSGIRVRVGNLPKKKNIHRDLKAAFDGVSGIINISPAVSGNKKTKDPVCKGFAYVDFRRELDANRFVENMSGQKLMFGRIQKQIKCEMVNSVSSGPANNELRDNGSITPKVAIPLLVDSPIANLDIEKSSLNLSVECVSDEVDDRDDEFVSDEFDDQDDELLSDFDDQDDELLSDEFDGQDDEFDEVEVEVGEERNNLNAISEPEASGADIMEPVSKFAADLTPLERIRALEKKLLARGKQQRAPKEEKGQKLERVKSIKKKAVSKGKRQKVPKEQKVQKLDIPGSAKRLNIKEKAKLTEVFSKYGLKTSLNSKEES